LALCAALPKLPAAEAVSRVRAVAPGLPVVAVTLSEDDEAGLVAMAAGARDYVYLDRPARLGAVGTRELADAGPRLHGGRGRAPSAALRTMRCASCRPSRTCWAAWWSGARPPPTGSPASCACRASSRHRRT